MNVEVIKRVFMLAINESVISKVYYGYSGRGMMGKSCTGVVMSHRNMLPLALVGADSCESMEEMTELLQFLDGAVFDNLGQDYIAYFPDLDLPEPEEREPVLHIVNDDINGMFANYQFSDGKMVAATEKPVNGIHSCIVDIGVEDKYVELIKEYSKLNVIRSN